MSKMRKIAVVLRGHKRTWDYTKKYTFEFFSNVADQVDYYVALWKTDSINQEQLIEDFRGQSLKSLLIEDKDNEFYTPWFGPAYLSNKASKYIFQEECLSDVNYDLVFDTRPDVAFLRLGTEEFSTIKNAVGCDKVYPTEVPNGDGTVWQGLADQCFTMDSKTHAIWNQRYRLDGVTQNKLNLSTGNHSMLWKYAGVHDINAYVFPWFKTDLVRPNIYRYTHDNIDHFNLNTNLSHMEWNHFNLDEKLKETIKAGIAPEDYIEAFGVYHSDAVQILESQKKAT